MLGQALQSFPKPSMAPHAEPLVPPWVPPVLWVWQPLLCQHEQDVEVATVVPSVH